MGRFSCPCGYYSLITISSSSAWAIELSIYPNRRHYILIFDLSSFGYTQKDAPPAIGSTCTIQSKVYTVGSFVAASYYLGRNKPFSQLFYSCSGVQALLSESRSEHTCSECFKGGLGAESTGSQSLDSCWSLARTQCGAGMTRLGETGDRGTVEKADVFI